MLALSRSCQNQYVAQGCRRSFLDIVARQSRQGSARRGYHPPNPSTRFTPSSSSFVAVPPRPRLVSNKTLLVRDYHSSLAPCRHAKASRSNKTNRFSGKRRKKNQPQLPAAHKEWVETVSSWDKSMSNGGSDNIGKQKNGSSGKMRHLKSTPEVDSILSEMNRVASPRKKKQKKKKKPTKEYMDWDRDIKASSGRLVLTPARLQQDPVLERLGMSVNNVRDHITNARRKMDFHQHMAHDVMGFPHDEMFLVDTMVTVEDRMLPSKMTSETQLPLGVTRDGDNTLKIQASGLARRKRDAESMSLLDLVLQFHGLGIDVRQPPDLKAVLKEAERQKFRNDVRDALILLELCRAWRPRFEIQSIHNHQYAELSLFVGNRLIHVGGDGDSKAEAQGKALIEAARSEYLTKAVGQERMEEYKKLLANSPAQQVSALYLPPLPEESFERLSDAIGENHGERMEEHNAEKAEFEAFHQDRKSATHHSQRRHHYSDQDKQSINAEFLREEKAREEKAIKKPEGTHGKLKAIRDALPIKSIREELLEHLRSCPVAVVSGGTGSGKSTQCPQYILEDAIASGKGADTRILVTQPRRIAAISVAERVAAERGERVGNSIGYNVRFNREPARELGGSIEFATTGVLMRRLMNDPLLDGISHIMIDEVHERDIDTDFLLVLLKDLLSKRPDLRIVLMSATLDAESFGAYFSQKDGESGGGNGAVPVLSVPTQPRYPVEVFHLEELSGESIDDGNSIDRDASLPRDLQQLAASLLQIQDQQLHLELEEAEEEEKATLQFETRSQNKNQDGLVNYDSSESSDSDSEDEDEMTSESLGATQMQERAEKLRTAVSMRKQPSGRRGPPHRKKSSELKRELGEVTISTVATVAQHVTQVETDAGRKGSILCFLPGWDEIKAAIDILDASPRALRRKMLILPLHSSVPKEDQHKVFESAEDGIVKVILATNIAESSVTIDDVLAVIDCGLVREMQYDAEKAMTTMETVPTSRASATQRLGRAGRVAPGACYRLYSRGALHAMAERPVPEIQRTALEATCLQTCSMTSEGVSKFLGRALDPPSDEAISLAMQRLVNLGAISVDQQSREESLTPLGRRLSSLPLDPEIGRMLIMGCVMNCLDPVLTAAACYSSRGAFYSPPNLRENARDIRKSFSETSDLMAAVNAYNTFRSILRDGGYSAVRRWAGDNYISIYAMNSIHSVRAQLLHQLNRIGFVANQEIAKSGDGKKYLRDDATVNQNGEIDLLATAIWSTGLPGNIAVRRSRLSNFGTFRTSHEDEAGLHPSSVTFHRKPPRNGEALPKWFIYQEMVSSSQVFLRGCTAIRPEQIMMFGGYSLREQEGTKRQVLDNWIVADAQYPETIDLLARTRRELDMALEKKVMRPQHPLPDSSQSVLDAVTAVLDDLDADKELRETDFNVS